MISARIRTAFSICGVAAGLHEGTAIAAEPVWPTATYEYVVVDQDIRTVVQQFGANVGLRVAISEAVQGRVRGRLPSMPPRQFLDHLANAYGLDWYFDGSVLAVSAGSEAETRFFQLRGLDIHALEAGLRSSDLFDPRFVLRSGPGADNATVSGPPRYVKLVQDTAAALAIRNATQAAAAAAVFVTVFRGPSVSKVQVQ